MHSSAMSEIPVLALGSGISVRVLGILYGIWASCIHTGFPESQVRMSGILVPWILVIHFGPRVSVWILDSGVDCYCIVDPKLQMWL